MRTALGQTLRDLRQSKGLTLRAVSSSAKVSLGYLSEIERGQKEASSELINGICEALDISLAGLLHQVVQRLVQDAQKYDLAA